MQPKVSLITPTNGRERYLRLQYDCFKRQTWDALEWLILDDSPVASASYSALDDPAVRYMHSSKAMSIGAKRNALIEAASGDLIMHLDDDDYYVPEYVAHMADHLSDGLDFIKLQDFFIYSTIYGKLGYWELARQEGITQVWSPQPLQFARVKKPESEAQITLAPWGFGFSYAYRRSLALEHPFPDMDWGEDKAFVKPLLDHYRCKALRDRQGLCLHVLHEGNSSSSHPQYELPAFVLKQFFPGIDEGFLHPGDTLQGSRQTLA